jgi:hypothetical protein
MHHGNTKCAQRLKVATFLLMLAVAPAATLPDDVASLLKQHAGFSDDQIAAVRRGGRIVRMLETESQAEVAFVGVTRLPISLATYLERVRSGTLYRNGDVIVQLGRFAEIPSMADLKSLRFESFDLRPLGTSAAAVEAAAQLNKQRLIASIREYEKNGTLGIGTLGEQPRPVDLAKQFEPLVKQSGYLRERLPAAYEYLLRYPHVPSRGLDDFFVWKQITFGFRPLTRVAQVSVWEDMRHGRREAIVLMKQIYANRYFQVSFQIDHLVSDDSYPMNPAVYLVSINQGRSEFLEGLHGKLIRPVVLSRTQTATEKTLDQARRDFQIEFRRTH